MKNANWNKNFYIHEIGLEFPVPCSHKIQSENDKKNFLVGFSMSWPDIEQMRKLWSIAEHRVLRHVKLNLFFIL